MVVAHLLMTRFAVDFGRPADPMPLTRAWFRRRFDLFEQYCLPSVMAQTFRDFRWLIYIAPKVDGQIGDRLRAYDPRIEVKIDDYKGALVTPADVLTTTRLDSDDGIGATVLEQIDRLAPTMRRATLVDFAKD
jgi:Putative rhamnosyl transferase